ncbi:MAG: VanZ family protein [Bacteroidales bacterium]
MLLIGVISFLSLATFNSLPSTPAIPHMDKIVHFCMYMALSYILLFDMSRTHPKRHPGKNEIIMAFIVAVCMGGTMELLQGYLTESRSADWWDMLANTCGAATGVLIGTITLPRILTLLRFRRNHSR